MSEPPPPLDPFRRLRRTLIRRRLAAVDPRLRIELVLLALLIGAFLFWQARVAFDSLARARGPRGLVMVLLGIGALLAASGGSLAGTRHFFQLRRRPPGPAWLALPVSPAALGRHLAWEARIHALWMAVPVPGLLIAMIGLVPVAWIGLVAAAFVWMLLEASRLGCAIAWRLALRATERRPGLHPMIRLLAAARLSMASMVRRTPARWRGGSPWMALWRKDLLLTLRPTSARVRATAPAAFLLLSVACWTLGASPAAAPLERQLGVPVSAAMMHVLAFGLALLAAATLGEWLIALSGLDPFPVLRSLPVGPTTLWLARMAWVFGACAVMAIAHALAARPLGPGALEYFLLWIVGATLAIGLLAVHYGITLFPHEEAAQRMYALSLGLAIASSLMIPLMGWIVLLTGVIHSARRLPRWSRLEDTA